MGKRGYPPEFRRRVLVVRRRGRRQGRRGRPRSLDRRPDDLQLAVPGPHRPRPGDRDVLGREGRAGRGPQADPGTRGGGGGAPPGHELLKENADPKAVRRYPCWSSLDARSSLVHDSKSTRESWHNLHHAYPSSARHGVQRGQIDPSAGLIRLFEKAGWATNVRWPTDGAPGLADRRTHARPGQPLGIPHPTPARGGEPATDLPIPRVGVLFRRSGRRQPLAAGTAVAARVAHRGPVIGPAATGVRWDHVSVRDREV
jgi:hypothetical protein